jgi:threonine dehydratase
VAIKALRPGARIWGLEPEGSDAKSQALHLGKAVQILPTSLARTLGSRSVAEDALMLMQKYLHRLILVTDKEAIQAGKFLLERAQPNTGLAASCMLAAARRLRGTLSQDDHVVLGLCVGNSSFDNWMEYRRLFRDEPCGHPEQGAGRFRVARSRKKRPPLSRGSGLM